MNTGTILFIIGVIIGIIAQDIFNDETDDKTECCDYEEKEYLNFEPRI